MVIVSLVVGTLVLGLAFCLPLLAWFRFRARRSANPVSPDLQSSLHRAVVDARRLRYETISVEQLLLALLDDPRVAGVLGTCSIDIEKMRGSLSEFVRSATPVAAGSGAVEPQASLEFKRVLQSAIARKLAVGRSTGRQRQAGTAAALVPAFLRRSAPARSADGTDALVAILDESESQAAKELRRHGATRLAVTRAIAHGSASADPDAAPVLQGDEMAVVLLNDDFTPMEFVVGVLQEHFGLDLASAAQLMLEIHHEGRAVCGRFPAAVAAAKVELVRAAASGAGHPLRCVAQAQ